MLLRSIYLAQFGINMVQVALGAGNMFANVLTRKNRRIKVRDGRGLRTMLRFPPQAELTQMLANGCAFFHVNRSIIPL